MSNQDMSVSKPDHLAPAEILAKAELVGVNKANSPAPRIFVLAILSGMFIAMGGMFMLLVKSDPTFSFAASQIVGALAFCLGLFLVVLTGAELFTGNILMICGKYSKRFGWGKMLKNWGIVYLGNLVGSLLMVTILFFANYAGMNGGGVGDAMITVATNKVAQPIMVLLFKGIMCNLLVCLAVWICYAGRTVVDKFFGILLPITAFVACGFEHSVANMFFLPMGLVMQASDFIYSGAVDLSLLTLGAVITNLIMVTLGNIIGGGVLVGSAFWLAYHKKES